MKILILGGTGTMGRYLMEYLSRNSSNDIYITSRSSHTSTRNNIHFILGNAHDKSFLTHILSEQVWDAVVDFMIYSVEEFDDRQEILLSSTKQYILLSSARVYAESEKPITEESERLIDVVDDPRFKSSNKYAIAKAKTENILTGSGKNNWTIIRPYITYSNTRFQLGVYEKEDWLYRVLHGRSIVFSRDISDKLTTITWGGDVSMGIAAIIGKESALGQIYHITNNNPIKWDDVLNIYISILSEFGYNASVCYVEKTSDVTNQEEKTKYDRIYNRVFDNSKINGYVNTKMFVDVKIGIQKCLAEFLSNPSFKTINWVTQARMDKLSKEKTKLSEITLMKDKIIYIVLRYLVDYRTLKKILSWVIKSKKLMSTDNNI